MLQNNLNYASNQLNQDYTLNLFKTRVNSNMFKHILCY